MATYRVVKQNNGDYAVRAELTVGEVVVHREAVKNVAKSDVGRVVTEIATRVGAKRQEFKAAQGNTGIAGITD